MVWIRITGDRWMSSILKLVFAGRAGPGAQLLGEHAEGRAAGGRAHHDEGLHGGPQVVTATATLPDLFGIHNF